MKRITLYLLGWYRQYRALRPDACRFDPTCSAYMTEAVTVHGTAKGIYLGLRRIARCHPWGGRGYDPVPGTSAAAADEPARNPASPAVSYVNQPHPSKKYLHA